MNFKLFENRRYNEILDAVERLERLNGEYAELREQVMQSGYPALHQTVLENYLAREDCTTQLTCRFHRGFTLLEQMSDAISDLPDKHKLYTKYGQLKVENGELVGIKTVAELEELREILKGLFPVHSTLIDSVYDYLVVDTELIEKYAARKNGSLKPDDDTKKMN